MGAAGCVVLASCSTTPRWIVVAGDAAGPVLRIDADLRWTDTLPVSLDTASGTIEFLAVSGGGAELLVGTVGAFPGAAVSRIRTADGQTIDHWRPASRGAPRSWSLLADSRTVVGLTAGGDRGEFWSAAPGRDDAWQLDVCEGDPSGLAVFGNAERIYVGCRDTAGQVVEIDPRLRRVVRTVETGPAGCAPGALVLSRTGGLLFLTCRDSGKLLYLDRVTLQPLDSIAIEPGVYALAVSQARPDAVATFPHRKELAIIDLRARRVRARIATSGSPYGIAITGDGNWAYVAQETELGGLLIKIDLAQGSVAESLAVPVGIRAVAVWPGIAAPVMDWR